MTKKIEVFASEALPGELETFPDIKRGWGTTKEVTGGIPPMKWFNAIQKRTDEAINAIAEGSISGYTFKDGATLDSHNDLIYDDVSKSWYFWTGEGGKVIPPDSNASEVIESDGGIWSDTNPSGRWVNVGDASLRSELKDGDGSLIGIGGGRALSDKLNEVRSLLDFGGSDDGITDNTLAFERIINEMKTSGQRFDIYLPYVKMGVYIYNGSQLNLPDGVSIIGENNWVTIDCSNNNNTNQHVIKLTGFRGRAERFVLKGNPNNRSLMGIRSEYNTELGGVQNVVFDNFEYGLDIDRTWYSIYSNLRFRLSLDTKFNGSDIRIGFYRPESEVNAIQFNNVFMAEQQKHSIAVYCATQNISMNGGSLETVGGARIKFYTNVQRNTFELNNVYIESHASGDDKVYLLEGIEGDNPTITCNNCMFRLGDNTAASEGSLAKNATVIINGGFSNSPKVYLNRNNAKVIFTGSRNMYFADSQYQQAKVKNEHKLAGTLPPIGFDTLNTMIPSVCNFISHTDTNFKPVFRVYIDSGASLKLVNLELNSVVKSKSEAYLQGFEKYQVVVTTPTAASGLGTGSEVFKVAAGSSSGAALLADTAFSINYISTIDNKYVFEISHKVGNSTRLGDCFITMKGDFYQDGIFYASKYIEVEKL